MTDSTDFVQVNFWFNQLLDEPEEMQLKKVEQLVDSLKISQSQADLIVQMLQADRNHTMPENVAGVEHDIDQLDTEVQIKEQPIIGSYRLLELIGSGGMGHVYLAERNDGSYLQKVAIKISQFHLNKSMVKRFENERQILAQLTHPNITQLLDGGTAANDQPYLVMEYIKGQSIDHYIVNHKLGLRQRLELILQTCDAVSFAHQNLVLHRDLKPANILVNDRGQVKLLDFGIGKLLSEDVDKHAQTMTKIMTRSYASPEQIKGQLVTTQSDLFSLAIIAYELVSGYHPYLRESDIERDQNVIAGRVKSITQRFATEANEMKHPELTKIANEKLKGDLENILVKALSATASDRYSSVESFADDIRNFLYNRPVKARKPSWLYSFKKLIQRQKALFSSVTVLTLCLLMATYYSVQKANDAQFQRNLALKESMQAKQISDFLTGIFISAKPRSDKSELTARDLLNQGMSDIESELLENPEQRFKLISVMLDTMESLGYFETTFVYVDDLYPECIASLTIQNEHCQMLLVTGGEAAISIQQDQRALTYLNKAEENARIEPVNQRVLVEILRIQFNAFINLRMFDDAVKATHEALNFYQNIEYSPHDILNIKSDLAVLATHQERYGEAKKYYEAMQLLIDADNNIDVDAQNIFYANYSFFFAKQKMFEQAIEQRKKAVDLMQETYDRPSFSLAWEQESLAKVYFFAGHLDDAIRVAKESLHTFQTMDSEAGKHEYILNLFIAQMLVLNGQLDAAKSSMEQLEKNVWDKRCLFLLVEAMIDVYDYLVNSVDQSLSLYESCIKEASYPTKFAQEFAWLLGAEVNFVRNEFVSAKQHLNRLQEFWQANPNESLPIQPKVKLLTNKIRFIDPL